MAKEYKLYWCARLDRKERLSARSIQGALNQAQKRVEDIKKRNPELEYMSASVVLIDEAGREESLKTW